MKYTASQRRNWTVVSSSNAYDILFIEDIPRPSHRRIREYSFPSTYHHGVDGGKARAVRKPAEIKMVDL